MTTSRPSTRDALQPDAAANVGFDAFISYSRKDIVFARALEKALKAYRPPRDLAVPQRHLRVFRDESDFTGPEYDGALRHHLTAARTLIVLCSPAARASRYVDEEIRVFADLHEPPAIVPVLVDGIPNNEAPDRDSRLAFPEALCELMATPLAADYRGFDPAKPRPDRGAHEPAWFKLLADLYGVERSDIEQREKRRQAAARRRWIGGTAAVMAALIALTVWALISRADAIRQGEIVAAGLVTAQAGALTGAEITVVERQALLALEALQRLRELGAATDDAEAVLSAALERLPRRIRTFAPQADRPVFAFAGDGLRLFRVSGSYIEAWNLRHDAVEKTYELPDTIERLDASRDGQWLAAVDRRGLVSMIFAGPPLVSSGPARDVTALPTSGSLCGAFSDDGTLYATLHRGDGGHEVLLWDTGTAQVSARLQVPEVLRRDGGALAPRLVFNNRARSTNAPVTLLVTFERAGRNGRAALAWRVPTRSMFGSFTSVEPGSSRAWEDLVDANFGPRGERLVLTRTRREDKKGELVSVRLERWEESVVPVPSAGAISPDGARFVTISGTAEDPFVRSMSGVVSGLRDTLDGSVRVEVGATGQFSTHGDRFRAVNDMLIRMWDVTGGDEVLRMRTRAPATTIVDSPGGRYLALAFADHSLDIWDTGHPQELVRIASVAAVTVTAQGRFATVEARDGVRLIDIVSGRSVARLMTADTNFFGLTPDPIVSPDGTRVLLRPLAQAARLLDVSTLGRTLWEDSSIGPAAFSADSKTFVVADSQGSVRALNATDGSQRWRFVPTRKAGSLQFTLDGRTLIAALGEEVAVLDAATGDVRKVVAAPAMLVCADGTGARLATAASGNPRVTDLATGKQVQILLPQTMADLVSLAFLPDGRLATVAGHKMSVEGAIIGPAFFTELAGFIWDTGTGAVQARIPPGTDRAENFAETMLEEEKAYLANGILSRDGRTLSGTIYRSRRDYWSVTEDRAPRAAVMWDLTGTGPREIMRRRGAVVTGVSDGAEVVVMEVPQAVQFWSVNRGGLAEAACGRVSRDLDSNEWRMYFGNRPYHATCGKLK